MQGIVYKFPKEKTIYGPMQIESRIDQNTDISQKLTLWGQVGSRVIRGNLMVVPIEQSLVYVEPIYLQATQSKLPELKRVIFGYDNTIVMSKTLNESLGLVFDMNIQNNEVDTIENTENEPKTDSILKIKKHFKNLKLAAREFNWTKFGKEINAIDTLLNKVKN